MDNRGLPPKTSNFYCLPGRAGGTPMGISSPPTVGRPTLDEKILCSWRIGEGHSFFLCRDPDGLELSLALPL